MIKYIKAWLINSIYTWFLFNYITKFVTELIWKKVNLISVPICCLVHAILICLCFDTQKVSTFYVGIVLKKITSRLKTKLLFMYKLFDFDVFKGNIVNHNPNKDSQFILPPVELLF